MIASRFIRRAAAALAAAAILAVATPPALAGWEQEYKEGKAALEQGKTGEAIKRFRAAIADERKEKAAAIKASGMFFEPYLPHFYLGMALFQKKEYAGAVEAFNTSESMKVIQKFKDLHGQLNQTRTLAQTALAAEPPAPSQPPAQPPTAPPIAQQTQSPPSGTEPTPSKEPAATPPGRPPETPPSGTKPAPAPTTPQPMPPPKTTGPAGPDPALAQAIGAAATDIAAVEQLKLGAGKYLRDDEKDRLDALVSQIRNAPAASVATAKRQDLQKAVSDLRTKVADRKKEEENQQAALANNRALRDAMDRANPTIQEAESFISANRAVLQPAESQRLNDRISAVKNGTKPDAVGSAAQTLRNDLAALKRVVADRGASSPKIAQQQYARGVAAYYEGKYDEAIPSLEQAAALLQKDAEVQAYLGSTLYRKYLLGRSQDAALKNRAEQAFRAAMAIRRDYALDPKIYPPKVVAFFREVSAKR